MCNMGPIHTATDPVTTTETSFEIVEYLRDEGPLSLTAVAEGLGLAKSTAHRHLQTLLTYGFVARDGGEYKVGLRFLDFGIYARNQFPFYKTCLEKVDLLAEESGEKARLITEETGQSVLLYRKMGRHALETRTRIGNFRPLHQIAAGKAILASLPEERVWQVIERLGLQKKTEHTITDPGELFEVLERIRGRGFAFNRSESIENLNAVGAAFHDRSGYPLGAISVSGPASRFKEAYLEEELPEVLNEIEIMIQYE